MTISFTELFPTRRKNDFFHSIVAQEEVLQGILSESIRVVDGIDFVKDAAETKDGGPGRKILSIFYNSAEPVKFAQGIANNIILISANERASGIRSDAGLMNEITGNVKNLIDKLKGKKPDIIGAYNQHINTILDAANASTGNAYKGLKNYYILDSIRNLDLIPKLARLSIIAATWSLWVRYNDVENRQRREDLAKFIVPQSYWGKHGTSSVSDHCAAAEKKRMIEELNAAEKHYLQGEYPDCISGCNRILSRENAEDHIRGKAYYLVVKCVQEHGCLYRGYDEAEFIHHAQVLGCKEAIEEWKPACLDSLMPKILHGQSTARITQKIICNSRSDAAVCFLASLPEEYFRDELQICIEDTPSIQNAVKNSESNVLLLLSDDFKLNFTQFLAVLDLIHTNPSDSLSEELTICLRTDESLYSSLIDTALKHVGCDLIKVFIIDEKKDAVQRLLGRHPLFYPIQSISAEKLNEEETIINFVVVSDDTDTLSEWLVREAFWMSCFNYKGMKVHITVLSPNATKLENTIKGKYPGMFIDLNKLDRVSLVDINYSSISDINSFELEVKLNSLSKINSFFYCVVATDDSLKGFELAKRLREWSIRRRINNGANLIGVTDLPVIAFFCRDDTVAHIARSISVQDIDKGHSWYNNYRIIPFGMTSELFNWDSVLNNITEETARCVHLQYSDIEPDADDAIINEGLKSYYSRVYNRDSSTALAISLPYRLFHMPYTDNDIGIRMDHIVPRGWNILNDNAYSNPDTVDRMSKMFKTGLDDESIINSLLMYEHARWCRFMLSRGWMPASPDETVSFIKRGNPKQQLFIARMHGCICPTEDLSLLQKTLHNDLPEAQRNSYAPAGHGSSLAQYSKFIARDRDNITKTADLLDRTWLKKQMDRDQ